MSRIRRVADIEGQRRDRAGAELAQARRELAAQQENLRRVTAPDPTAPASRGSAMLAHRQAAGRMVDRLVEATDAQRHIVKGAEESYSRADRRARQMQRAADIEHERIRQARRRKDEKRLEDTAVSVAATRRVGSDIQQQADKTEEMDRG